MDLRIVTQLGVLLVLLFAFTGVECGAPGGLCPDEPRFFVDGINLPTAVIPCDYDCKTNHNASSGTCGDNYNCICNYNGVNYTPTSTCTYFNPFVNVPGICQCPLNLAFYSKVCEFDCKCNHNAANGVCKYNDPYHPCVCDYSSPGGVCPKGANYGFNVSAAIYNVLYDPQNLIQALWGFPLYDVLNGSFYPN